MKRESLVMTLIGKDRPGLVASLSAIIDRHGGNWEESRMVELEGEFAGLLHVQVPGDRAGELTAALRRLEGLAVTVARAPESPPPGGDSRAMTLEIIGQDHPGIVHQLAEAIARRGVNIEELTSELRSAPMAGIRWGDSPKRARPLSRWAWGSSRTMYPRPSRFM